MRPHPLDQGRQHCQRYRQQRDGAGGECVRRQRGGTGQWRGGGRCERSGRGQRRGTGQGGHGQRRQQPGAGCRRGGGAGRRGGAGQWQQHGRGGGDHRRDPQRHHLHLRRHQPGQHGERGQRRP
ncbi:hypothetical protein NG829_12600 [Xanthomonas sacchari]|nr:hypothetical protein NG829_12600 [Xanthomonas sacchari]